MSGGFFSQLTRRKTIHNEDKSKLARVLTLTDLTALGVGSTLGLGVYILAGSVAKTVAGPAVCLSFLVAAIASALAGLCYAEFAARVPKAGSAYVYSYVTVGEFVAFIIGWNLILEYVIGTASVSRGLSSYLDELFDHAIINFFKKWMPINVGFLSEYPDFLSCLFIFLLTVLLCIGVKESTRLNNLFTILNLLTVSIVIVAGSIKANPANWSISKDEIPEEYKDVAGDGGFFPFGIAGVMAGAAKCFYGFVGFDAVATTGEEAKNPQRNIPFSIVFSLIIIFLAYFGISTVLTLMLPYYDQNPNAPFPYIFEKIGWLPIKWIVTTGAVFALCTTLLGSMFPLPRIIYAMSNDGLIFKFLNSVHSKTKTPLLATIVSGILSGIMATLFDLNQLIDMMSIGTLLAYTIVGICVLILRYQPSDICKNINTINLKQEKQIVKPIYSFIKLAFNFNMNKYPNITTSKLTNWCIMFFIIAGGAFSAFLTQGTKLINLNEPYFFTTFIIITIVMIIFFIIISRQPLDDGKLSFKVPWIPFVPCLSIIFNLYLMFKLDIETWVRFIVWLIIGFLIYFFYGIKKSEEKQIREKQVEVTKEITKF